MGKYGAGKTQLTEQFNPYVLAEHTDPTWSPDGAKIAFRRDWEGIYVINTDGIVTKELNSGLDRLTSARAFGPINWTP